MPHTGIYRNASERVPCVIDVGGIRVGFVNYTYGTNAFAHHRFLTDRAKVNLYQPEEMLPKEASDFVIAVMHCGGQHNP